MTCCPHCFVDSATLRWQAERIEELEHRLADRGKPLANRFKRYEDHGKFEGFTGSESRMLEMLMTRDFVSKEELFDVIYHSKRGDDADLKIVAVLVSKIRRRIKPLGLEIRNEYDRGYYMPRELKPKAIEQLAPLQAA